MFNNYVPWCHHPIDDTGFDLFIYETFLRTTSLFSEKNAMKKDAPLTVEFLYQYLAGFCKSILPLSEDMANQNSSPDLFKTLIQVFYEGILPKSFTKKLEETSCSTWPAAQQNFRNCLTQTNVQLAIAQQKAYRNSKPEPFGQEAWLRRQESSRSNDRSRKTKDYNQSDHRSNPRNPICPSEKTTRQEEDVGANTFRSGPNDCLPVQKLSTER